MNSIIGRWGRYASPGPKCLRISPKVCGNRVCIIRRRTCLKDPPEVRKGGVQGPRCERCFPRTLHDQSRRSFLWSSFVFSRITIPLRFLHHQSSWNRLCDRAEFINNEKKVSFSEAAEWVNVSPFQVHNKEEWSPDSADDHKPQSTRSVFQTPCQSDTSGMMTWLRRSAGDLLRVTVKSATFEKSAGYHRISKIDL